MERTDEEIQQFEAAASAIEELATAAGWNVGSERWEQAGAKYALITEIAYGMTTSMSKAATNDLKVRYPPADLLEGLPSPEEPSTSYL